jgi:tRNA A37 threonylcarbamoyladenosine synthetase subunit TsaC/SUA5/YrdC
MLSTKSGLPKAQEALNNGQPVGLPGPLPLPYVVAARSAKTVNEVKGRPADQPVTLIVQALDPFEPFVAVNREALALAAWLSRNHLIHLQIPVKSEVQEWAKGAVAKGLLGVSLAWRQDLFPLLGEEGFLYASSANVTGEKPAATANQLALALREGLLILADEPEQPGQENAASGLIARIAEGPDATLVRGGIQNELAHTEADTFLADLVRQWRNNGDLTL